MPSRGLVVLEGALSQSGGEACASCTPRVIENARALFERTATPSREEIEKVIVASACNCTGYKPVLVAMLKAAGLEEP